MELTMKALIPVVLILLYLCGDPSFAETKDMVLVPGGEFEMRVEYRVREGLSLDPVLVDERGTRYAATRLVHLQDYYIDRTEVTNQQFKIFLDETGYQPEWPRNFLRHWVNGSFSEGRGSHPVVWVSMEDAKAYASWAGKRLPTEAEWQKAAQGTDGRTWPWGNFYDSSKANMDSDDTKAVGTYPDGASPFGCLDMAGNVWEWTDSRESDGYHYFSWLRGGSYYHAKASRWYMQGGPLTNFQRTKIWHMTPALNRCATLGFRCAKEVGK
jgi:formylglycine-generating enzyme required for sulfatase activity